MKQPGKLLLSGILLMSIMLATAMDCTNGDLSITSITTNNVAISWDKTCFNNETSYLVSMNVTGGGYCSAKVPCEVDGVSNCKTSIQDMGSSCTDLVRPCREVIMVISGGGSVFSTTTKLAPLITESDWKLEDKTYIGDTTLYVKWGPPEDPSSPYKKCAETAMVSVTCIGIPGNPLELETQYATITDIASEEKSTFDLGSCGAGDVTPTVTYVEGDIPTETKKSIKRIFVPLGWIKCYECDGNSTKCNDPFSPSGEIESEAIYKSCAKKDGDGDRAERYGLRVSGQDGACDTNQDSCSYCNEDLCNNAPHHTVPITLFVIVISILQGLFY